jgi:hypothetical protein
MNKQEREYYEYIIAEGKMVHKQTGNLLDTNQGLQGSKWIFVMSTSKNLYAGEVKAYSNTKHLLTDFFFFLI